MSPDVLLHAALARLGPVTVSWDRSFDGAPYKGFTVRCGTPDDNWAVHDPTWENVWNLFILEAVARR